MAGKVESLGERLIRYTAEMVKLSGWMPSSQASKEIATGLLQAVMDVLPRYHAACEMESDRAFMVEMRRCLHTLRDARVWLSVIERSALLPHEKIQMIENETDVVEMIFSRIIQEIERRVV
ncbi:MAG: four helix bundle protein [Victivallales bacterium]|nr:four helix bundle protein [Victivallales bacterium]